MSRKKYWDIDSSEYSFKKSHLVKYLRGNSGNIRQVEREMALDLAGQLDDESFIEYIESLNEKFTKQYKAAFRSFKSSCDYTEGGRKSKPVRLSAKSEVQLNMIVEMYMRAEPESAKDKSKSDLTDNALEWIINKYII